MSAKIFIRERRKVEKGEKKPRFRVVGTAGTDLKLKVDHVRKQEIEQIASSIGAELILLQVDRSEAREK